MSAWPSSCTGRPAAWKTFIDRAGAGPSCVAWPGSSDRLAPTRRSWQERSLACPKSPTSREGVRYIRPERADIFFVTLQKMEGKFSPTTMYKDYAISPTLFHWESQSTTGESSPTGQRYINHLGLDSSVCLFARESPATVPFVFLGKGTYVQHERERPMRITWRLDHAVPGDFYLIARAAA